MKGSEAMSEFDKEGGSQFDAGCMA